MRTIDRVRASSARPVGTLRLVSMLGMLALLFMLIQKAGQPAMWAWLADDADAAKQSAPLDSQTARASADPTSPTASAGANETPAEGGSTDLDPLEQKAAQEIFQALTDGSTQLVPEEMPAYWRLFAWTESQSFDEMKKRAASGPVFDQFAQRPAEQRGKLFELDLNVRRVLSYDAPQNSAGIEKVYEIWGFTHQSQAWLYCVLTAHLPPGMPEGPSVHERATFVGYFLKTQGYHAAGARPRDKSLPAPLLIGRVQHRVDVLAQQQARKADQWREFRRNLAGSRWLQLAIVGAGALVLVGVVVYIRRPVKTGLTVPTGSQAQRKGQLAGWLESQGGEGDHDEPWHDEGEQNRGHFHAG